MGVANISGNILTDSGASLSSYLPLTGGTLTGALNGTSATFSGTINANSANSQLRIGGATTDAFIGVSTSTLYLTDWATAAKGLTINLTTGAATFSSSVGIAVTPSAWATLVGLDIVEGGGAISSNQGGLYLSENAYFNAGWKYKSSSISSALYSQVLGVHAWYNAPSGTAGNAISFTQAMTLASTGNLLVGTTTDAGYKLDVNGTGKVSGNFLLGAAANNYLLNLYDTIPRIHLTNSTTGTATTDGFHIYQSGSDSYILNKEAANLYLGSNNGVNLTIASTGAATFSSSVTAGGDIATTGSYIHNGNGSSPSFVMTNTLGNRYELYPDASAFRIYNRTTSTYPISILNNGNVGIGTSSPSALLHVLGGSGVNQPVIFGVSGTTLYTTYRTSTSTDIGYIGSGTGLFAGGSATDFGMRAENNLVFGIGNTERMRITSGGIIQVATDGVLQVPFSSTTSVTNVSGISLQSRYSTTYLQSWNAAVNAYAGIYINSSFIGTSSLGTGTVYSNGGALTNTNPSDERLKDNIEDISWGLNEILKLRPVEYTWKDDRTNQGKQYGFIAQEVQPIIPELVKEFTIPANEELGTEELVRLGLEKDGIFAALVKAIQEQQEIINQLSAKVTALENKS